ncbi:MAG: hypothetical protein OK442_04890 [Thaumarchaeota archaeon]|nr:hypothetical protein [Nitrososphaerota archaeon]
MAKSARELLIPILFLAEGVFWLAIVATGGAILLILAALAFIASGLLLIQMPDSWATKPLAGASALFGLTLTVYQVYQAATLFGSSLSTIGLTSGAISGVFAIVCVYLELATLSMGSEASAAKKV